MKARLLVALLLTVACGKKEDAAAPSTGGTAAAPAVESGTALPTVCDTFPPYDEAPPSPDAVSIADDDWRQLEFVAERQRPFLNRTLSEYLTYREAHKKGNGYTSTYPRQETFPSLETLGLTKERFGPTTPLVVGGKTVKGGFSVKDASGAYLYGFTNDAGSIVHMGLRWPGPGDPAPTEQFKTAVSSVMANGGLIVVDWRLGAVVETLR